MHDVIVIGGGPGGSTAATLLARRGFSVALLERERFPRFQIGESLLPYNNDLFDRLGVRDRLRTGDFVPKYGAEFCTATGEVHYTFRFDRNLDSEQYHQAFQVKRADFDTLMLRNAAANGVDVREQTSVAAIDLSDPKRAVVQTAAGDQLETRFVVDASGNGSVLGTKFCGRRDVPSLKKIATFAHFRGVVRAEGRDAGNIIIVVLRNAWFWVIPVNAATTSIGLVADRDHVKECGLSPEELLTRTIAGTPWVAERMRAAERVTQVYTRKDFSFRMDRLVGENFALVGDAAGFLDPIFSTGVFIAMKSADLAAAGVEQRLREGSMRRLRAYERDMQHALGKYLRFINHFYRREFLEVFLQPPEDDLGLLKVIVGVLAGNVFARRGDRFRLALFFMLVRIQKWRGNIAPRIEWEKLPAAASL